MSQKQVMPKSEDLIISRSLEINAIWTFDTELFSINHAHILLSSLQLNTDNGAKKLCSFSPRCAQKTPRCNMAC